MLQCLAEGATPNSAKRDRRHAAIVAKFEAFLAENPDRLLYLTEICAGIGVAERTLRGACEEHLGIGPIRYLTLRRMHLTRRALLHTDPSESTVTRIATDHGFWELGRFSRLPCAVRGVAFGNIAAACGGDCNRSRPFIAPNSDKTVEAVAVVALATARRSWTSQRSQANNIVILTDIAYRLLSPAAYSCPGRLHLSGKRPAYPAH